MNISNMKIVCYVDTEGKPLTIQDQLRHREIIINGLKEPRNLAGMTLKETEEHIKNASEYDKETWRQRLLELHTLVEGIEPDRDSANRIIYEVQKDGEEIILYGKRKEKKFGESKTKTEPQKSSDEINNENQKKLPQNVQHLLMEIGQKSVLFRLYLLTQNTDWEVYENIGQPGCDLIMLNKKKNRQLKIEVKTRQKLYSTSRNKGGSLHFTLTENEYINSDFLISLWYEKNYFFIVPIGELQKTSSKKQLVYKYIINEKKDGTLNEKGLKYVNKWDIIEKAMDL